MHNNNIKCTSSRLDMHFVIRRPTYVLYVVTVTKVYVRTYTKKYTVVGYRKIRTSICSNICGWGLFLSK